MILLIAAISISLVSPISRGEIEDSKDPLPFDEAFKLTLGFIDGDLVVRWEIKTGYYLYRHTIELTAEEKSALVPLDLPEGTETDDLVFGKVQVYYGQLEVTVREIESDNPVTVVVKAQGCYENSFCYTPRTRAFDIESQKVTEQISSDSKAGR